MSNPDELIEKMLEDKKISAIILVSLMSSDNDPETLPTRLETSKNLKIKAKEAKEFFIQNGKSLEGIDNLISRLDECIHIIEQDIKIEEEYQKYSREEDI